MSPFRFTLCHRILSFSPPRRRRYFESIFPDTLPAKEVVDVAQPEGVRRTRAQVEAAAALEAATDIDNDPMMAEFTGHTAVTQSQLIGHERSLCARIHDTGRITHDSMKEHREVDAINIWTQEEKDIFTKR